MKIDKITRFIEMTPQPTNHLFFSVPIHRQITSHLVNVRDHKVVSPCFNSVNKQLPINQANTHKKGDIY